MASSVRQLCPSVSCHAWNSDQSMLAVCPNSNEVHIYKVPSASASVGDCERIHVLKNHDQLVSGVDWAPNSNCIVTCSHDRNAYVWNFDGTTWQPVLVILRLQRAATSVKWSSKENKFAVGSGAKSVCVCYYEQENNWWVSKLIRKKHSSTVQSVAWHPNNALLATASTDFKCRIFNAFIKGVDAKTDSVGDTKFGDVLMQIDSASGWVHGVNWSPSGEKLAFTAHDSSLHVIDIGAGTPVQTVSMKELPLRTVLFLSETRLVAAGYDNVPFLFGADKSGAWSLLTNLDEPKASSAEKSGSTFSSAFEKFRGQGAPTETLEPAKAPATIHENCITTIQALGPAGYSSTTRFSSSGLDGKIVMWELKSVLERLANLKL